MKANPVITTLKNLHINSGMSVCVFNARLSRLVIKFYDHNCNNMMKVDFNQYLYPNHIK